MTDGPAKRRRTINLRRNRVTTVTGLAPGDRVTPIWDWDRWEWRLVVESTAPDAPEVKIEHKPLTPPNAPA